MTPFKHIGDSICFQRQRLYWDTLPENIVLEIEIINFFKGKVIEYRNSAYMEFAVIFLHDVENPKVKKGDMLILHFPYRTLFRAIDKLHGSEKRQISREMCNDNVYLKFIKPNKKAMEILGIERLKETPELSLIADKILSEKDDFMESDGY